MSVIGAIAGKMRELGHSSEDILAVVLAADEAQDKSERARISNAERQARYRNTHNVTSNVTPVPKEGSKVPQRDNNQTLPSLPENTPPSPAKKSSGSRIPENWQPSEKTREYGRRKLGFSESQIEEFVEDLRVWAEAESRNVAVKRDWDSALKGWMRREKRKPQARAGPNGTKPLTFAEMARMDFTDEPRPNPPDKPKPPSSDDSTVIGFAGRLSQPDRDHARGQLVDLGSANARWRA